MSRDRDLIEKVAAAPAAMLDKTVIESTKVAQAFPQTKSIKKTKEYWNILGPGLTTGASDDDPSGIATYSQTGAQYGFQLMWLSVVTFPLMAVVQEMCARIGLVTGRGLAGNIRRHFSKKTLYLCTALLFAANAFNIGADLGAMAKGVQLLRPSLSFPMAVVAFAVVSLLLQIYLPYARYAKYLKWLAMILLAYVASAIMAHLDWGNVLHRAAVPTVQFTRDQLLLICAILGTTISPYLFFWQTSQEVEAEVANGKKTLSARQETNKHQIRAMRIDVWSGMFLSNLVMFFIIAACGAILYPQGINHIQSASQAAEALRPFAGNLTFFLFAIGIIGTGMLAIPVLAGASSYAVSESFHWGGGLDHKLRQAHAFYGVLIISVLIGLAINFLGIDPIKALIYSAVANGIVAPFVLALIVIISSSRHIMGSWVNKPSTSLLGWAVTTLMVLAGGGAIFSLF
ncbi:MAG TPA: Nramp family divalent metal transporter [Candidatus Saccharimonadales bacterium]|nr:Nramp family divalent metal transporter [Candidatus Saccharimonadales bacterium]